MRFNYTESALIYYMAQLNPVQRRYLLEPILDREFVHHTIMREVERLRRDNTHMFDWDNVNWIGVIGHINKEQL